MNSPLIEVNGLASGYVKGLNILQGVDLVLKENEAVSIIGPNGAGKSTLLKAIMGLIPIFGGKIYFKGNELFEIKALPNAKSCLCPPDKFPALCFLFSLRIGNIE